MDAGHEPQGALPLWYLTDVDINDSPCWVGAHVDIGEFENEKRFVDGFDPSAHSELVRERRVVIRAKFLVN